MRFGQPGADIGDRRSHAEIGGRNPLGVAEAEAMKVRASVKRMCENCKIVRRKGVVRVICTNPRHKQRQG